MGIRKEIEKLKIHARPTAHEGYVRDAVKLDDVLSILDEWELVTDNEAGKLIPVRLSDLLEKNIRPGDRIAIYVRRVK